ncbi:MAG: hypothetical protein COU46_01825 [Candidatus Niyogibacteria bacterium CG10_big_fil_rev_8_21_14_0_10_42_19]|uniref:Uncharacterized protein n=1 Tax=Candidatus Niyogibacteria bacterium CG10_big_fil_rev_8_21_14_0_10_42_19 TaxID=1974725 RepID=A0A2H0TFQ6_9BACT|nr:MAG: hypothetical protein COU46_01825 [Candidatus Niyogibacteria bacterium CG10_big_fil_rev_8_21_14_0_10_42_19]
MPNQEVLNYIKESKASGASDDVIRTELIKAGWFEAEVNEALDAFSTQNPNIKPYWQSGESKRFKFMIVMIIGAFLILGGGAGAAYYFFVAKEEPMNVAELNAKDQATVQVPGNPSESTLPDEAIIVTNFSGLVPVDYSIDDDGEITFNIKNNFNDINAYILNFKIDSQEYILPLKTFIRGRTSPEPFYLSIPSAKDLNIGDKYSYSLEIVYRYLAKPEAGGGFVEDVSKGTISGIIVPLVSTPRETLIKFADALAFDNIDGASSFIIKEDLAEAVLVLKLMEPEDRIALGQFMRLGIDLPEQESLGEEVAGFIVINDPKEGTIKTPVNFKLANDMWFIGNTWFISSF